MRFLAIIVLLASLSLSLGIATMAFAAPASRGYAAYRVNLNVGGTQITSIVLNETSRPTGQNGFVELTFVLASASRNVTYSSVVNSSSLPEIFPYFVGLNNQSFSYQTTGFTLHIHILNTGTSPVTFNGQSYQATSYNVAVAATNTSSPVPVLARGNIVVMPSGLIYSIDLELGNVSFLNARLIATSLPLAGAAAGSLPLGVALLGVGIVAAVALAAPAVFLKLKRKRRSQPEAQPVAEEEAPGEKKPSYWVD